MPDLTGIVDTLLGVIVKGCDMVFSHLFAWLPDDPFIGSINSISTSAISQGLGWLNWLVNVPLLVSVLSVIVTALLAWASYKVTIHIFNAISKAIEMLPFE